MLPRQLVPISGQFQVLLVEKFKKIGENPNVFELITPRRRKGGYAQGMSRKKNAIKMELQSIFDKLEASKNDEKSLFLFRNAD